MANGPFSTAIRLLLCKACGNPVKVAFTGGPSRCQACGAWETYAPRPAFEEDTAGAMSEAERLKTLWSQKRRYEGSTVDPYEPDPAPPGLQKIADLRPDDPSAQKQTIRALLDTLEQGQNRGFTLNDERRIYWLGMRVKKLFGKSDPQVARAALEQVSESMTDKGYRQAVFNALMEGAYWNKDFAALKGWIARGTPAPTVLDHDTQLRMWLAILASREGDYSGALVQLGKSNDSWPIATRFLNRVTLLRAAIHERLGNALAAERELGWLRNKLGNDAPLENLLREADSFVEPCKAVWHRFKEHREKEREEMAKAAAAAAAEAAIRAEAPVAKPKTRPQSEEQPEEGDAEGSPADAVRFHRTLNYVLGSVTFFLIVLVLIRTC